MPIPFVKMHGIGNDYVYLNAVGNPALAACDDLPALARAMSDRHRGIGSDGLILVCMPTAAAAERGAHVRMRMFNSDGSESEMCGNGVRCVAKFAHDRLGIKHRPMLVETGRGILSIDYALHGPDAHPMQRGKVAAATVDMGEPVLDAARVPVRPGASGMKPPPAAKAAGAGGGGYGKGASDRVIDHPVTGDLLLCELEPDWAAEAGVEPRVTAVSMGNPHAVFFCADVQAVPLDRVGPVLEKWEAFPKRTNVHFVQIEKTSHAIMRTWERGAGLTQACGTGACAVLVAGVRTGRLDRLATITLPGGDLRIKWVEESNHVFMTGPAEDICEGVWQEAGDVPAITRPRPTLVTERLVLRPMTIEDAEANVPLAGDKRVYQHTLNIPHPYTLEQARAWLSGHERQWAAGTGLNLSITLKTKSGGAGETVGCIGLVLNMRHRTAELGYWIAVPHWNKGYATEASKAMIDFAFKELGLNRVSAFFLPDNEASGRVMEKAGMKRECLARQDKIKEGKALDSVQYSIVREGSE